MASFSLPPIFDTPDLWGPPASTSSSNQSNGNNDAASSSVLPPEFRDIPFVPFAKVSLLSAHTWCFTDTYCLLVYRATRLVVLPIGTQAVQAVMEAA